MRRILGYVTKWDCGGLDFKEIGITEMESEVGKPITYINDKNETIDTGKIVKSVDIDDSFPTEILTLNNGIYVIAYV